MAAPTVGATATIARTLASDLLKLSKHKLSALVAFTAGAGYLCRVETLDPPTSSLSTDSSSSSTISTSSSFTQKGSLPRGLAATTVGTFLTAACANTLNQLYERVSDSAMARTRGRPLPSGRLPPRAAAAFALASGLSGLALLTHETNPVATGLAGANIALYAGVYTPLKAISPVCTWVGAVVGALPPLLGWAAASGGDLWSMREAGGWALASWLFVWQIPHFHALAVLLRADYRAAGLRMLAVSDPVSNARWAHWMALAMLPVGPAVASAGVVSAPFVFEATAMSWWMVRGASALVANPTCPVAARSLFKASISQLPICMGFLLLHRIPYPDADAVREEEPEPIQEIRLHHPWEVFAPFPFLPVPIGPPAVVLERTDR